DDDGAWRLYAKTARWRPGAAIDGRAAPDDWNQDQAGFRADWRGAAGDTSVMGDLYQGGAAQRQPGRQHRGGANLLARWDSPAGVSAAGLPGRWSVQGYLDRTTRALPGIFGEELNTA